MNILHLAARVAQQSMTATPVKHDISIPLFKDESYKKNLEKATKLAEDLCGVVTDYIDDVISGMQDDESVLPEEIEKIKEKVSEHAESICSTFIKQALGLSESEESEEDESDESEKSDESDESEGSDKVSNYKPLPAPKAAPKSKFAPGK